jgi:hypothetical protein
LEALEKIPPAGSVVITPELLDQMPAELLDGLIEWALSEPTTTK